MSGSARTEPMLPEPVRLLILEEQARQDNRFLEDVDLDAYLIKLSGRAEILSDSIDRRCRGFVAFYCNDEATKQAFITLVLVDPRDRGLGIGPALVTCVLDITKRRGFTSCRLEVARRNEAAHAMYRSLGFRVVEERGPKDVMEIAL
jgi:ribosomal protein S18 acetylase RimI-like enzyme